MRCVECGHEIKDGAVFCIRCGAMQVSKDGNREAVGRTASAGSTGPRNVKTFEPTPKRGGGGVVIFVIAAIAVLAAIVALAMFALNPGSSGSSSSAATVVASSDSSASASASASSESSSASSSASSSKSSASASSTSKSSAASKKESKAASQASTSTTQNQTNQTTAPAQQQQPAQQEAPAAQTQPVATDDTYTLSDSSTRLYTKAELQSMSTYDLWIARNEIFARHGRMFKDPDLQAYFNSKSWYTPIYTPEQWDATQSIADIESKNAALMLEVEQEKKSSHL